MIALRRLKVNSFSCRQASSLVSKFNDSINSLPLREAVRYTEKNLKWTAKEFNVYVDAHANALIDIKFMPGDTIAVWLPECAEKHVILMSAAKIGLKVVDVDTKLTEVADVRSFLKSAECKAIYFKPQHEDTDFLLQLRKAIPEFFEYEDSHGQAFHSKFYPTLKYFIHTGFDIENGCLSFKSLFLPHPQESEVVKCLAARSDEDSLYSTATKGTDGKVTVSVPLPPSLAILDLPAWSFAKNIINQKYFEHA